LKGKILERKGPGKEKAGKDQTQGRMTQGRILIWEL